MFRIYSTNLYAISPTFRKVMISWTVFVVVGFIYLDHYYYTPEMVYFWLLFFLVAVYHVLINIILIIKGMVMQWIMKKDMETPWIGDEEEEEEYQR